MQEKRLEPREQTLRTGTIHAAEMASAIDCAIFDISESGACILVPAGAEIPDTFDLAIDPDRASRLCRLAWRAGSRIGVSFQLPMAT